MALLDLIVVIFIAIRTIIIATTNNNKSNNMYNNTLNSGLTKCYLRTLQKWRTATPRP